MCQKRSICIDISQQAKAFYPFMYGYCESLLELFA